MIPQREVTYALSLATVQVILLPEYSVRKLAQPLTPRQITRRIRYFTTLQPFLIHQH
jgi:hypothetical protein